MKLLTRDDLGWLATVSSTVIGCFTLAFVLAAWTEKDQQPSPLPAMVASLREVLDPGWPVDVQVSRIQEAGTTAWNPELERYQIRIHPAAERDPAYLRHILAHEWAHVMCWDAVTAGAHDAVWGVSFARAYRLLLRY